MDRVFMEPDERRLTSRLTALTGHELDQQEISRLRVGDADVLRKLSPSSKRRVGDLIDKSSPKGTQLESIIGAGGDFVPASFLTAARQAANGVGRIVSKARRPIGTAVMITPTLVMTNNHVASTVEAAADLVIQFDYELGMDGVPLPITEFGLDPAGFFWTSPVNTLDTSIVGVGGRLSGSKELGSFGYSALSASAAKHAAGDHVTIVEHPSGDYKQVALRGNRVLGVGAAGVTLHYTADTLPGSSGSPVFNDQFQLVALHHAGGHELETKYTTGAKIPDKSNEGVRISSIVAAVGAAELAPSMADQIHPYLIGEGE